MYSASTCNSHFELSSVMFLAEINISFTYITLLLVLMAMASPCLNASITSWFNLIMTRLYLDFNARSRNNTVKAVLYLCSVLTKIFTLIPEEVGYVEKL